ncbi:MAG: hypothetical protein H0X13_07580 [Ramlibacter sp.]|nr:hypothetical protein [Ramlibacter sp.]
MAKYRVSRATTIKQPAPGTTGSPAPVTLNRVDEVSTVVGGKVDFLSWQKNVTELINDPKANGNTILSTLTDTVKIFNAMRELAGKLGLFPTQVALFEFGNKLERSFRMWPAATGSRSPTPLVFWEMGSASPLRSGLKLR